MQVRGGMDILAGGRNSIGRMLGCGFLGLVVAFFSGHVLAQGVPEPAGQHTSTSDAPASSEAKLYGPVGQSENILMIAQGLPLHEQFSAYQIMRWFLPQQP